MEHSLVNFYNKSFLSKSLNIHHSLVGGDIDEIVLKYQGLLSKLGHNVRVSEPNLEEMRSSLYDVHHVHSIGSAILLQENNIPYYFTLHGMDLPSLDNGSDSYLNLHKVIHGATLNILPHFSLLDFFDCHHNSIVLSYGVDVEDYKPSPLEKNNNLLFIGNLNFGSSPRLVVDVAKLLSIPVTLVGAGFETESLNEIYPKNITFYDELRSESLKALYYYSKIGIFTSGLEMYNSQKNIMEMMASGIPIVAVNNDKIPLNFDCEGVIFCKPDQKSLSLGIIDILHNYEKYSNSVRVFAEKNSWDKILNYQIKSYNTFIPISRMENDEEISLSFKDGPLVSIGDTNTNYTVEFWDSSSSELIYNTTISGNQWTRCSRRWYTDWNIKILDGNNLLVDYLFDCNDKKVHIKLNSSSIGDVILSVPYVEEFRKKHNCVVICSTEYNFLFDEVYPEIQWKNLQDSIDEDVFVSYDIDCIYSGQTSDLNNHFNPLSFDNLSTQKMVSSILGLEYSEKHTSINLSENHKIINDNYICVEMDSFGQFKNWKNYMGWLELFNYLNDKQYKVVLLTSDNEKNTLQNLPINIVNQSDSDIGDVIGYLQHCDAFVGLGGDYTWLSWAMKIPTVLIDNYSEEVIYPQQGLSRINSLSEISSNLVIDNLKNILNMSNSQNLENDVIFKYENNEVNLLFSNKELLERTKITFGLIQ